MPAPTLPIRSLNVSLSGVCDLVLAYKNEPLPLNVPSPRSLTDVLFARNDSLHLMPALMALKDTAF